MLDKYKLLLVVNYDSEYIENLENVLEQTDLNFTLDHAEKLPSASAVIAKEYDAVFLDLVASENSSDRVFDLCKELSPHVPVIVVSPTEKKELIERSINNGSHAFLVKENINSNCVVHAIAKAIDRFQVNKQKEISKFSEFRATMGNLEKKLPSSKMSRYKKCSHAKCRLNEAIHRLKLMA
jgi:DNA-binding NtrC family response regulator